jgi:CRP/FNR family transcriptional regulator, cyclic AMP receptor protein
MATKSRPSFDPKSFLAVVGEGRGIGEYRKDQIVFSQGDPADAVFYIQSGKVKVTVVSEQGKEAVVAMLGTNDFFGEGCLAGQALRMATVLTMMDSVIVRLERDVFRLNHIRHLRDIAGILRVRNHQGAHRSGARSPRRCALRPCAASA